MPRWDRSVPPSWRPWPQGSTVLRDSLAPARSPGPAAHRTARELRTRLAKRLLDLAVALACLILVSPLLVAVAALIRFTTPGPALFRQTRLGRGQRPFVLYKFRTMYDRCGDGPHREYVSKLLTDDDPPAGGDGGLYKLQHDERITPLGRFLRRVSVDELPQLLNVIRGDMSMVGPRPALSWEAELIDPLYLERFRALPGLPGLWQGSGRNNLPIRPGLATHLE